MQVDLAIQAHKLEKIIDEIHDDISEELGDNHPISNKVLMASARAFAIFCDLTDFKNNGEEEE